MALKLSPKYWSSTSSNQCRSKFGFVKKVNQKWFGFVTYYLSETPENTESFKQYSACVTNKCRKANQAKNIVNMCALTWAEKLVLEPDPRIVLMYPVKKLYAQIKANTQIEEQSGVHDHIHTEECVHVNQNRVLPFLDTRQMCIVPQEIQKEIG